MTDVLARVKAVLASTATRWLIMTQVLPVDLLNRPPATGEWSATECLIHLLDTEHIFPARCRRSWRDRRSPPLTLTHRAQKMPPRRQGNWLPNLPAWAGPASPCWSVSRPRTSAAPQSIVSLVR